MTIRANRWDAADERADNKQGVIEQFVPRLIHLFDPSQDRVPEGLENRGISIFIYTGQRIE